MRTVFSTSSRDVQLLLTLCLVFAFQACTFQSQTPNSKDSLVNIYDGKSQKTNIDEQTTNFHLYQRILHGGDTNAYKELRKSYANSTGVKNNMLYYSLIMSSKYSYNPANYDIYLILSDTLKPGNFIAEDSSITALGEYYLLKFKQGESNKMDSSLIRKERINALLDFND